MNGHPRDVSELATALERGETVFLQAESLAGGVQRSEGLTEDEEREVESAGRDDPLSVMLVQGFWLFVAALVSLAMLALLSEVRGG